SMVYGFIKQSNGHVRIYSELDRGTTIRLYLPKSDRKSEGAVEAAREPMPRGSESILVVEDDEQVRASVVMQLTGLGYSIGEAADGASALGMLASAKRPFDLVLTDVIMPGAMNGRMLADEVGRRWPATKVIFMSGYTENRARRGRNGPQRGDHASSWFCTQVARPKRFELLTF
ncbi:MAG TPA: response regulator, partial [Reyranella sp.]|nr:response regulator [Reyranella sp.]